MFFSNDREHVAEREAIPLSLQAPHLPPSRSHHYVTNDPFFRLQFSYRTQDSSWRADPDVACSFVVLCAPQAAKHTNERTTTEKRVP